MLLAFFLLLPLLSIVCNGIQSPSSIGSSVSLLWQNNLNSTEDASHIGFLLLDPMDHTSASKACQKLNETLLDQKTISSHLSDILPQIQYLTFRRTVPAGERFWVADGAIAFHGSSSTHLTSFSISKAASSARFPVLCTQSATSILVSDSNATPSNTIKTDPAMHPLGNTFTGFRNLKSFRFLGIPYSNTVVRWQHSTLNSAKSTTFDATKFGPECFQTGTATMSEQCLFINVLTPFLPSSTTRKEELRPVVMWIHGGAFTGGTGSDTTFEGGNFVSRGDVVFVTINYRLSSIGFLALPNSTLTGNYGLGDQVTALEWIQQNIRAFGGDPTRVTIWGQSAGAGSVRALMASPKAIGKFSAAIPSSNLGGYDFATIFSQYPTIEEESQLANTNAIISATNCTNSDIRVVIECLSKVPASTLVNLPNVSRYVVIDHNFILSKGLQVTGKGPVAKVPSMWGTTADDGAPFIGFPQEGESLQSAINAILTPNLTDAALASGLFPLPNTGNATLDIFNVTSRIATDGMFRCLDQATIFSALKHHTLTDVFYYQFDKAYQTPGFDPNAPTCDAPKTSARPLGDTRLPYLKCHSGDLFFEFGSLHQNGLQFRDVEDLTITQLVMDYWTSFVRTHDPNPDHAFLEVRGFDSTIQLIEKSGPWKKATSGSLTFRSLNIPPTTKPFSELKQCDVIALPLDFYETNL